MVCRGVREQIGARDRMGGPNEFANLEMPPEVGIIEAFTNREDGQNGQGESEHHGKRKRGAEETNKLRPGDGSRSKLRNNCIPVRSSRYRLMRHRYAPAMSASACG